MCKTKHNIKLLHVIEMFTIYKDSFNKLQYPKI